MPPKKNQVAEAIEEQTEMLAELLDRLDDIVDHLAQHVCAVCKSYYGTDDLPEEKED